MSSMKQTDRKRTLTTNQTKRSTRIESRENTKPQQEKVSRTLKAKEANKKTSSPRVNNSVVVDDTKKSVKRYEVNNKLGSKPSIDLDKELNDGKEESDSETVTDSVSSSGDSRAIEHDLHNLLINTSSNISKNAKDSSNSIVQYSTGNNSKGLNVHPKPPSTPSSTSSEILDDEDLRVPKEADILNEASNGVQSASDDEMPHNEKNTEQKEALSLKIAEMKTRIEQLEDELREVAALEISLYSVVQQHGSSPHKMHTPAHRLSRLYIHARNHLTEEKSTTIARNIISGLIMIYKSCGNDVTRLTFWWSNIIILREIITQASESSCQLNSELEGVESRIFTQIVESIWWQTLTPNMLTNEKTRKLLEVTSGAQRQSNFSINLWQNAFHDAFKRLCPVRAGGRQCGCLPVLAGMVMEQCVSRLDVAMFNAILRESAHEFPVNVAIDPITESRVLPIRVGDLSFGSGAQLKKAVGTWSRWLIDEFSADTDSNHTTNEDGILGKSTTGDLKCFRLLNSLSHLLMVPKDLLMDKSIRTEVCPSISLPLLTQILRNFTPDELCPDPVPKSVLEAINTEFITEGGSSEDDYGSFPYAAARIIYKPPSSIDVAEKVSEAIGNGGFSREECLIESRGYMSEANGNANARYELLREIWSS